MGQIITSKSATALPKGKNIVKYFLLHCSNFVWLVLFHLYLSFPFFLIQVNQFYYLCQRGCLFFNFANPPSLPYLTGQKNTKQEPQAYFKE